MPPRSATPTSENAQVLVRRSRDVGIELASSVRQVLDRIPGAPHRPTHLARRLGLSRVLTSRMINSTAIDDPLEVLDRIPGPETLRALVRAAGDHGVPASDLETADAAIDRFERLIRDDFGTRNALKAAISASGAARLERFEQSSRYQVFSGMSQVVGVQADLWLTCMVLMPSASRPDALDVIALHGAIGMRRLRPDVTVHFTFGAPHAPPESASHRAPLTLEPFYANEPAQLESIERDGVVVHHLVDDRLGQQSKLDMLAVGRTANGSARFAAPGQPKRGTVVYPDLPVKLLVSDVYLADGVFPDRVPELIVHKTGAAGRASVNDPRRDHDRVLVPETIETLEANPEARTLSEVPTYPQMLEHVGAHYGFDTAALRGFRARVAYPVHGFQFAIAFDAPAPE